MTADDYGLAVVAGFRSLLASTPSVPPLRSGTSVDEARARQSRIAEAHGQLWDAITKGDVDVEHLKVLRMQFAPDALVPSPCGGQAQQMVLNDPVMNFAECKDLCFDCRAEALRQLDLIEAGIHAGRATEPFAPAHTFHARCEVALQARRAREHRRRERSLARVGSLRWKMEQWEARDDNADLEPAGSANRRSESSDASRDRLGAAKDAGGTAGSPSAEIQHPVLEVASPDPVSAELAHVALNALLEEPDNVLTWTRIQERGISHASEGDNAVRGIYQAITREWPETNRWLKRQKANRGREATIRLLGTPKATTKNGSDRPMTDE